MYNRTEEYYKVISCENPDFEIYTTKVTDTGFEIGLIVSNTREIMEETRKIWEAWDESNDAESRKLIAKQLLKNHIIDVNGDKFYCTMSPSRKNDRQYLEENQYNFYETFELTKAIATDKIKVILYYYGEPVTIELEKIK